MPPTVLAPVFLAVMGAAVLCFWIAAAKKREPTSQYGGHSTSAAWVKKYIEPQAIQMPKMATGRARGLVDLDWEDIMN